MFGVGGIGADNLASFRQAGAAGVGLGSSLYVPGIGLDELAQRARQLLAAWQAVA
jgi:2-dehydro-3-deoxyphosphogalactonate aldolase